jgi:hypothetical protein
MARQDYRLPLALQLFVWFIPMNIYIIGDWMGSGIQWLIFRYQETNIGNSSLLFDREIHWILSSQITGKSAISIELWGLGILVIFAATILILLAYYFLNSNYIRLAAFLNLGGVLLLVLAILNLYGLTLQGPAGIAIPFGIPVILGVAYYQYRWTLHSGEESETNFKNSDKEQDLS